MPRRITAAHSRALTLHPSPIEADHSQLKHRLRPMRGLRTDQTAQIVIAGHAFLPNLRRGHDELGMDAPPAKRVAVAFSELARAI
jgi:transposase, IS6 family